MRHLGLRMFFVSVALLIIPTIAAQAQNYEPQLRAVAAKIISQLEAAGQKSGTVLDFTDLKGQESELGRFLAQEIADQFVGAAKSISFIDRANLQHLLRENKLSMDGLVNPETSKKLGNMTGIDTIIFGTITPIGKGLRMGIRAVAVETGKIVASQSITLPEISELGGEADVSSKVVSPSPIPSKKVRLDVGVHECDRLAASPVDQWRVAGVKGVEFEEINAPLAVKACDDARRKHPQISRFAFQAARVAVAQKNFGLGLELYRKAADLGNAAAMTGTGILYRQGQGVSQDLQQARIWFEKAANLGELYGMAMLGTLYANGLGVNQNYNEARRLFEKSASLGGRMGMRNLGILYENGQGVSYDRNEAIRWYEKAAALGDAFSRTRLNNLRY